MAAVHGSKVEHLIVDSGAFIRNIEFKDIGQKIYCVREVVSEIRDKATRQRLQVLPYNIIFKQPTAEAYNAVVNFSKKTGDFASLSAVDLRLLALAYQLETENVGTEHIKTEPSHKVQMWQTNKTFDNPAKIAGFYLAKKEPSNNDSSVAAENTVDQSKDENDDSENANGNNASEKKEEIEGDFQKLELNDTKDEDTDIKTKFVTEETNQVTEEDKVEEKECHDAGHEANSENADTDKIDGKTEENDNTTEEDNGKNEDDDSGNEKDDVELEKAEGNNVEDDEDDDEGWITPDNIGALKLEADNVNTKPAENIPVACLTTDFAMQNVLLQMGLNVLSVDGRLIKRAKSYVLRCYGCFKVTSDVSKVFCPKCGNATLRKVSMTVNDDGSIQYFLSSKKPINTRGSRHSLPTPKGGRHAHNPILCEDQKEFQYQQGKRSQTKYDALDPDYIAHASPFAPHDLNSRAATHRFMGHSRANGKHNPNENKKVYGRRK